MDKKNTVIGILLVAAALAMMLYQGRQYSEYQAAHPQEASENSSTKTIHPETKDTRLSTITQGLFEKTSPEPELTTAPSNNEELFVLENEFIQVRFTTRGGAIKDVALKNFPAEQESTAPYLFNENAPIPALAISLADAHGDPQEYAPSYQVIKQDKDRILFEAKTPEGVKIYRGYSLALTPTEGDPYIVHHETRFVNNSQESFNLKKIYLNMGTFPPTRGDTLGEYLNVGYFDGDDAEFIKSSKFDASKGFLGMGQHDAVNSVEKSIRPIIWASTKNQFFASVLTPNEPGTGIYAKRSHVSNPDDLENSDRGLMGNIEMELGQIMPGSERLLGLDFYIGPKEFTRLEALGNKQDLIMQFGFFGLISKFLLILMRGVNNFIPNWGLTIITVTFIIKLVLWPLTAIQVRSSKRMAKIQGPLKEIKEKYKDNPQKVQMETMKLFKENRVNPAAGCLPLFVQLPIFLGLYFMLRTSSELRFAEFLWIPDLSLPDTITHIRGFAVNILPLLMGASMFFQMKMTPSPSMDGAQTKILQFMPFIFLIFCYNFPSGLVLYWTIQNLLTIAQQAITNRMKDPAVDNIPALATKKAKKTKKSIKK